MAQIKAKKPKNIILVMFIYWVSVIIWQTVRPVGNRSLIDTAVKIALFVPVLLYGFHNSKGLNGKAPIGCLLIFLVTQALTLLFDSGNITSSHLITVVFMIMQIVIFIVFLNGETCKAKMIEKFCYSLIIVALVMCVYNVIFNFKSFSHTFSGASGSYGHECASFLYSNHEFGLYLSVAILCALWSLFKKKLKAWQFILLILLFSVNLLSTYSRTAILGLVVAVFILTFFYSKKAFLWLLIITGIFLIIVNSSGFLHDLIFNKVLKGTFNNDSILDEERASMYRNELEAFRNGTIIQKLFGQGYAGGTQYGGHDAYLIILLTGGISMLALFILAVGFGIYNSILVIRKDNLLGALLFGFIVFSLLYMVAQTPILFYSTMDSFFITMITVLIPLYVSNGIRKTENFYESSSN